MTSVDALSSHLSNKGYRFKLHSHSPCDSAKAWIDTLKSNAPSGVADLTLTKTIVIKPKGGTLSTSAIIAVTAAEAEFAVGALAKHLGAKEGRVAGDDVVTSILQVSKIDATLFSLLNVGDKSTVTVAIDSTLFAKPTTYLGFRAFSGEQSLFVGASNVQAFLHDQGIEFISVDLSALGAGAPAASASSQPKAAPAGEKATKSGKGKGGAAEAAPAPTEGGTRLGMEVAKSEDFSLWYQQVLTKTEMMDYYDISGCYIIRPAAYKIWKEIQKFFGESIEELGVEDCYFPMFVSAKALEREKDHIEGFAPEVAWVTKAGSTDLAEHIAVRPTSETVMYPAYSKWITSHRDLPLRLNQWCNVVRWEFKNPQPFLRTREFLWQEGHSAFANKPEADAEVLAILDLYRRVYEEVLAVPVVPGKKSENEKFAGGLYTTTVEGFIPTTGRAIQGATSHCLGQNFAKMFKITFESESGTTEFAWQNSWGLTTRTIGVMVMVHGDDKGLVLPPRVASTQVVVVPLGITGKTTEAERKKIMDKAEEVVATLKAGGIRAKGDFRDNYTPPFKFNHWELRGVPIRLEVGPKDIAKNEVRSVQRFDGAAKQLSMDGLAATVKGMLQNIQDSMFNKAKAERDAHLVRLETWDNFVKTLDGKNIILAPWCERVECEKDVKERSGKQAGTVVDEKAPSMGAKTLCIPFKQPTENPLKPGKTKCFACNHNAVSYTLWGRSY